MKKHLGKKALLLCVVVVMVFAFTSVAFADGTAFNGHCKNNFTLSRTWNKVNDTELELVGNACYVESNKLATKFTSTLAVAGHSKTKVVNPSMQSQKSHIWSNSYKGTATAKVTNHTKPGTYIKVTGEWYIYGFKNNCTDREINY